MECPKNEIYSKCYWSRFNMKIDSHVFSQFGGLKRNIYICICFSGKEHSEPFVN